MGLKVTQQKLKPNEIFPYVGEIAAVPDIIVGKRTEKNNRKQLPREGTVDRLIRSIGESEKISTGKDLVMVLSKTEVNFRRLLASAPRQQNQAKLAHYVATLREQLEHLAEERTHEGSPRVPKAMLNEYSEKIEAIAANLVSPSEPDEQECEDPSFTNSFQDSPKAAEGYHSPTLGLRKRLTPASITHDRTHNNADGDKSGSVHLDDAAHAHLDKHRKLQENLTDEMVGLARQLKERSLIMSQSLQNTERILDSTESAVEQSLASTNRVNVRATEIYSETSKTTCFTWLILFAMTCVFIMVVLLIRVT